MAFKDRLKQARLAMGITQLDLGSKISVAKSTITGYEKGNSEPDMLKLANIMNVLNVDANFLFQDEMKENTQIALSSDEQQLVENYRQLDDDKKEFVRQAIIMSLNSNKKNNINAENGDKEVI